MTHAKFRHPNLNSPRQNSQNSFAPKRRAPGTNRRHQRDKQSRTEMAVQLGRGQGGAAAATPKSAEVALFRVKETGERQWRTLRAGVLN